MIKNKNTELLEIFKPESPLSNGNAKKIKSTFKTNNNNCRIPVLVQAFSCVEMYLTSLSSRDNTIIAACLCV